MDRLEHFSKSLDMVFDAMHRAPVKTVCECGKKKEIDDE